MGILITDPANPRTNGVKSENEKSVAGVCGCCNSAVDARMVVEASATLSFFLITGIARVYYAQGVLGANWTVAGVSAAIAFSLVLAFNYATGTTLGVLGT